jgi:uncharacterized protein Yka (UPF0111/DUF47 family)
MRLLRRAASSDQVLYDLFEEAGRNAERACGLLRDLIADFPDRSDLAREVLLCEQEGDRIVHDILHRVALNGDSPKAPFRPEDVHALAGALDDIVDYAEQTADSLGLYGIEAPMQQAEDLAEVLAGASRTVALALASLREGREMSAHLVEIHQLENDGDRISRDAIASLFSGGIDPMVVIRWKDIFESLEDAIDSCEKVAHVLEGIALKHSH